jgi:DNA-binding NarL/FixJ family response regulator
MPPTHTDEGLRAAVEARTKVPGTPILVLSQYVEVSYADDLLADGQGSIGYLLKDRVSDVADFLDGLHRVAVGGTVLDPEVVAQLFARRRRHDPMRTLTAREREVLRLVVIGQTDREIAGDLYVSLRTVNTHVAHILAKLEVSTRRAAAAWAREHRVDLQG